MFLDEKVFPAIRAGAQGYLLKDIRPDALVQAVRDAYQGKAQLHPDIAKKLMAFMMESSQEAVFTDESKAENDHSGK